MDAGIAIPVEFSGAEFKSREESNNLSRVNLGNVEIDYVTDSDLSLVIFYKRNNEMDWQQTPVITLDKNKKRFFRKLQNGLTVIDFYPQISGSIDNICEISLLKIFVKEVRLGKHN